MNAAPPSSTTSTSPTTDPTEVTDAKPLKPSHAADPLSPIHGAPQPLMPGVQRFVLSGAAIALGLLGLYIGQSLLIPLALAALLAFVLDPMVTWLRRWSLPRGLAVGLVITVTLSLLAGATVLTALQVGEIGQELPTHRKNIQKKLRDLRPALVPSGSAKEVARLMGMVEGELVAAKEEMNLDGKPAPKPTQVAVQADNNGPLTLAFLTSVGVQLATAALVVILLVFMLLELRDRLLRLMGGDPHLMADALSESAERVSRYLLAQVLVNIGYGLPMGLGLWLIGVPGAWLWGGLAAVLRFVPYLGPAVGAVFPVVMAFAVDPGWSMVLWTLALIGLLELISNNVVEPLAYGGSTGVSPLAVLLSAAFWASMWGPMGLVLATPLTVCLVVIGRHLAPLRFLDTLLSSTPVFDEPTQLYHRLITGDFDEAEDMAYQDVKQHSLNHFYSATALPMLAFAARQNAQGATAAHRHRLLVGTARIVAELQADEVGAAARTMPAPSTLVVGLRSELDALSADMLTHALHHAGHPVRALPIAALNGGTAAAQGLGSVRQIYLCSLSVTPQTQTRLEVRRLRRQWPDVAVHLVAWTAPEALANAEQAKGMGVDRVMRQLDEVLTAADEERNNNSSGDSGGPGGHPHPEQASQPSSGQNGQADQAATLMRAVQRATAIFRVPRASLTVRSGPQSVRCVVSSEGGASDPSGWQNAPLPPPTSPLGRVLLGEGPLQLSDVHGDPRHLAGCHAMYQGLGSFAAAPMVSGDGAILGVLALHAPAGHSLTSEEIALLGRLAQELRPQLDALTTASSHELGGDSAASGWLGTDGLIGGASA